MLQVDHIIKTVINMYVRLNTNTKNKAKQVYANLGVKNYTFVHLYIQQCETLLYGVDSEARDIISIKSDNLKKK